MPKKTTSQTTPNVNIKEEKPKRPDNAQQKSPVRIDSPWLHEPATQAVFKALNVNGFTARAVGGAIRNALMGLPATDIDFATTALPDDVMKCASKAGMSVHPTGIAHGTLTLVCKHHTFEITTLRKDVTTDGRRATVAFSKNWVDDANRRDFTINALYCDSKGTLFDPLGGYQDLQNRKIRFIGDARQRIREDFLRILRFFRFYATFGDGPIDPAGLEACISEKTGIKTLSGERIQSEILRLIIAQKASHALRVMNENAILEIALGLKPQMQVFENLIKIEKELDLPPDGLLRLCALVIKNKKDARTLTNRLKLSNVQSGRVNRAAQTEAEETSPRAAIAGLDERALRKALYLLGPMTFRDRCLLEWARNLKPSTDPAYRRAFEFSQNWTPPDMPFKGADLIAMGFKPGPVIGATLSQFETWWIEQDFPASRDQLEKKLVELAKHG